VLATLRIQALTCSNSQDMFDESVGAVAVSGGGVTVDMLPICVWSGGFTV